MTKNRPTLKTMTLAQLKVRLDKIRDLNPHGYEYLQSYRNTLAQINRLANSE